MLCGELHGKDVQKGGDMYIYLWLIHFAQQWKLNSTKEGLLNVWTRLQGAPRTPALTPLGTSLLGDTLPPLWAASFSSCSHLSISAWTGFPFQSSEPRPTPGWCLLTPHALSRPWVLGHALLLGPAAWLSTRPTSNPRGRALDGE